jgi:small subunit ribosomal protein S6
MRPYEIMVILDPTLDERTVAPSLDAFLNVIRTDGGTIDKVDIWGKRRLATRSPSMPKASTRSST